MLNERQHAPDFRAGLERRFQHAEAMGLKALELSSGELHRDVGGYPGKSHAMPNCCGVMRQYMKAGDEVLNEPPKGKGASLKIKYVLPR